MQHPRQRGQCLGKGFPRAHAAEGKADPLFRHIQLLLVMFPGEEPLKIKLVDTGQWMTLPCVVHPALVRELRELLGEENVVLK